MAYIPVANDVFENAIRERRHFVRLIVINPHYQEWLWFWKSKLKTLLKQSDEYIVKDTYQYDQRKRSVWYE